MFYHKKWNIRDYKDNKVLCLFHCHYFAKLIQSISDLIHLTLLKGKVSLRTLNLNL